MVYENSSLWIFIGVGKSFACAQSIDSLKLQDEEVPPGYSKSSELMCVTPHASFLFDQMDLYASVLGKVTKKDFQSAKVKGKSPAGIAIANLQGRTTICHKSKEAA